MNKEYIVSLNRDVDYDEFWNQIETSSSGLPFIPDRAVVVHNNRDASLRSCHYLITDEEAEILRNDSRVYSVEIPPDQRTDIQIRLNATQSGNFVKPASSTGNHINWGLVRSSNRTNVYGSNLFPTANVYYYDYDGTGVDVVIQDSGIERNHPEFRDAAGNSRVQLINWYTASGITGTQSANHYRDFDGHGTHVAGIAVGKNYGWAKNANIYSVKINGLEGTGDSGTGISVTDCFDVIKLWHRNKPTDPITGVKRPTIVNASWGYTTTVTNTNISAINYRGNSYSGASITGYINKWNLGIVPYGTIVGGPDIGVYTMSSRVGSVDTDVQELIDEGVHICIAGGNEYGYGDVATGIDYNNYITHIGTTYYHRGMSPHDDECIKVGAIDSSVYSATLDQKSRFSNRGPIIDVFAPGANILSCTSNTNLYGAVTYTLENNSNVYYRQLNLAGTSQASPQVCGVSALYLQENPGATPRQLKNWVTNTAVVSNVIYSSGLTNDFTNYNSIIGAKNIFLYSNIFAPLAATLPFAVTGSFTFENINLEYR